MSNGLGRGLSSLIPPKETAMNAQADHAASSPDVQLASSTAIVQIPLGQIVPNPMQPRQHFDPKSLDELMQSIDQYGLLEPVVVTAAEDGKGGYQLVAGERRFRAHQQLGKDTISAIIRSTSELERLELALIENLQREDLNPIETAQSMAKLINDFGLTQAEAAKKLGVARSTLANMIRLLDLPSDIQIGLAGGIITEGHAKILLGLDSDEERMKVFIQLTTGKPMSVRELSETVGGSKKQSKKKHSILDHEMQALEDKLQSRLGTKVQLKRKASGATQITIDAHDASELKRIVDLLS